MKVMKKKPSNATTDGLISGWHSKGKATEVQIKPDNFKQTRRK